MLKRSVVRLCMFSIFYAYIFVKTCISLLPQTKTTSNTPRVPLGANLVHTELGVRQGNLNQADLASDGPELVQVETSLLDDVAELGGLALNTVDDGQDTQVSGVGESGVVTIVGGERSRGRGKSRVAVGGVHDLVTDEDSAARSHSSLDALEDLHAVVIGPIVDDVAQPVNIGVLDGVLLEEVVLDKADTTLLESGRVLAGPDFSLGLLDDGATILENKVQVLVDVRKLEAPTTHAATDINDGSVAELAPWEIVEMGLSVNSATTNHGGTEDLVLRAIHQSLVIATLGNLLAVVEQLSAVDTGVGALGTVGALVAVKDVADLDLLLQPGPSWVLGSNGVLEGSDLNRVVGALLLVDEVARQVVGSSEEIATRVQAVSSEGVVVNQRSRNGVVDENVLCDLAEDVDGAQAAHHTRKLSGLDADAAGKFLDIDTLLAFLGKDVRDTESGGDVQGTSLVVLESDLDDAAGGIADELGEHTGSGLKGPAGIVEGVGWEVGLGGGLLVVLSGHKVGDGLLDEVTELQELHFVLVEVASDGHFGRWLYDAANG